jgi:hypothetical protein
VRSSAHWFSKSSLDLCSFGVSDAIWLDIYLLLVHILCSMKARNNKSDLVVHVPMEQNQKLLREACLSQEYEMQISP